jgi:hypothetical protein
VPVQHLQHPDPRHHPRGPKKLALADETAREMLVRRALAGC